MKKLLLILLFCVVINAQVQQCPSIVSRASWGSRQTGPSRIVTVRPPPVVVVHHSDSSACSNRAQCSQQMINFQNQHINNGWGDIGYNFCIGGNGEIYQGRGWGFEGAHARGYNNQSTGICFIGNFERGTPTHAAIRSFHDLVSCGTRNEWISRTYSLVGHKQVGSSICPGDALHNLVRGWPRFVQNAPPIIHPRNLMEEVEDTKKSIVE